MTKIIKELYEKAKEIGDNPKLLKKRLNEFKNCLEDKYKDDYKFDFESKSMIGNKYVIKWNNTGITSQGQCQFYRKLGEIK